MEGITLRKDSEWDVTKGEACRVIRFVPMASVENGKVIAPNKTDPYASVLLECKELPEQTEGFVTHWMDFAHLWAAFKERGVKQNEEVIIFWCKTGLKSYAKMFSVMMPKLWVMICRKGTFESMTDPTYKPELKGEARFLAESPIAEWKPEVIE